MLTTTSKTLGASKTSVLRRVTTTSFLHSGFLISNCTMRPPTVPVAPSATTEYCIRPRLHSVMILVGHSYGGSVITAAGTDDRVVGLVYIAALAPDADETSQSQQEKFPVTDVFKYVEIADGRVWMRPEGVECFAGDLSDEEKKVVWATHYAPAADLFSRNAP